jgi:hypothetical protein
MQDDLWQEQPVGLSAASEFGIPNEAWLDYKAFSRQLKA